MSVYLAVYYKPVVSIKPAPAFDRERFIRAEENCGNRLLFTGGKLEVESQDS